MIDNPETPDETALLYRKGHLTAMPTIPGGKPVEVTEVLWIKRFGETIISTLPSVHLGNAAFSQGTVRKATYVSPYVAKANFRAMIIKHTQPGDDGWTTADLDAYTGDPDTLQPLVRKAHPVSLGSH